MAPIRQSRTGTPDSFVVRVTVGRYSCERDEAMMGHEHDQHASGDFRRFVIIANPSGGGSANGLHELL